MNAFASVSLIGALTAVLIIGARDAAADDDWTQRFDFDGDGRADRIEPTFTGGAHCCYRFAIILSSTGKTRRLPFEIDGGYVGGIDLSNPDQLDVRRDANGRAELFLHIATYAGHPYPLPDDWKRSFGVTSHRIAVSFPNGRLRIRNLPQAPSATVRTSRP